MGLGVPKGGGAGWLLLVAAGVLLAVAATATTEEDVLTAVEAGRDPQDVRRLCKRECRWEAGQDERQRRECEHQCRQRYSEEDEVEENAGGKGSECRMRCMRRHRDEPWRVQECTQRCERRQQDQDGELNAGECRCCQERCARQHAGDASERRRCVQQCRRRQQEGGECRCSCRERCERRHQGDWSEKQRCLVECRRRQQEGGGSSRGGECHCSRDSDDDNDLSLSSGERCQQQCRHYHDQREKQQCMRDCRRRGGGPSGRGREEGDERRHGWETVAGAVLQVV